MAAIVRTMTARSSNVMITITSAHIRPTLSRAACTIRRTSRVGPNRFLSPLGRMAWAKTWMAATILHTRSSILNNSASRRGNRKGNNSKLMGLTGLIPGPCIRGLLRSTRRRRPHTSQARSAAGTVSLLRVWFGVSRNTLLDPRRRHRWPQRLQRQRCRGETSNGGSSNGSSSSSGRTGGRLRALRRLQARSHWTRRPPPTRVLTKTTIPARMATSPRQ